MRIDVYIKSLIRQGGESLELESNQPAKVTFQSGERLSAARVEHKEVVFIVKEAVDEATWQSLASTNQATCLHDLDGLSFRLSVQVVNNETWRLIVIPADAAGAAAAASRRPNLEPPMAPIPRTRPSIAPPKIAIKGDEPKMNQLLREMVRLNASDLHLTTGAVPMVRLHGAMTSLEGHPVLDAARMTELLEEILPERNRAEFEKEWDTDFAHSIEGLSRFRANYFRDRTGPGAVFRQIPFSILPFEKLGLPEKVLDLCWLTKGLVVVTGPTGSGKSTTLATLVDYINQNRADHIITIEDPIEFVHPSKRCLVNQREVGTHTRSFKKALRAALREDPDIVLVGEMRDLETIAIAIETAETGHLVFGTLHTTSATSTIDRIIDQFPPEQQAQIRTMLSESLRGVIAQVLCKKKGGGRAAAYEILVTTPAISNLIRDGKTYQIASMLQTGKNIGMQTMNEHLLQHVQNGVVEPEEAYMKSNDKGAFRSALEKANITLKM
jgi:twitching motility protein PilT